MLVHISGFVAFAKQKNPYCFPLHDNQPSGTVAIRKPKRHAP